MADEQRLDGWKAIGNFLGRDRTTVMRWMRERGLPVHRVPGGRTGTVYALRSELSDWLESGDPDATATDHPALESPGKLPRIGPMVVSAALLLLLIFAISWFVSRGSSARGPSAFGIAATSVSGDDDATRRFAGELTADLARFAEASGGLAVYDGPNATDRNVQFRLRSSIEGVAPKLAARVWLVSSADGSVPWSQRITQSSPEMAVLRERVAANVVGIVRCASSSIADEQHRLAPSEMALLLTACQRILDADYAAAVAPARALTRVRPDLATGWAVLSLIEGAVAEDGSNPQAAADARADAARAKRIAPGQALVQLATVSAMAETDPATYALMEAALRAHPDDPPLLRKWSLMLFDAGFVEASVAPALQAVAGDPTWMTGRDFAVRRLAAAGRFDDASALQAENERLWPGHPSIVQQRGRLQADMQAARPIDPLHRESHSPADAERAITNASEEGYHLALQLFRDGQRAAALDHLTRAPVGERALRQWSLLFWPSGLELRREPTFFRKMVDLGLPRLWSARRKWPDFCDEPGLQYDCRGEMAKLGMTVD